MREIIFDVETTSANQWIARNLAESIVTDANSMEELRFNVREAVKWRFVRETSPVIIKLRISKDIVVPM